jgi:hypothetical protein
MSIQMIVLYRILTTPTRKARTLLSALKWPFNILLRFLVLQSVFELLGSVDELVNSSFVGRRWLSS